MFLCVGPLSKEFQVALDLWLELTLLQIIYLNKLIRKALVTLLSCLLQGYFVLGWVFVSLQVSLIGSRWRRDMVAVWQLATPSSTLILHSPPLQHTYTRHFCFSNAVFCIIYTLKSMKENNFLIEILWSS